MKPLLNRNFKLPDDGWFQIVPRGEFPITVNRDQYAAFRNAAPMPGSAAKLRVVQVVDAAACDAMLNTFNAEASAAGFAGLPIDYDHFSTDAQKSSEAAGWIMAMQNRDDGLYAQVRWAGDGERKVATGAFRFVSPVFEAADCALLSPDRVHPLRLAEAALTNKPNMRGIRPLTNRDENNEAVADMAQKGTENMNEKIKAMLKLAATASDDEVCAAVQALADRVAGMESDNAKMKTEGEALANRVAAFERAALETQVEGDLAKFADRIANRDQMKAALLANRAETLKVLEAVAEPVADKPKLLNRKDGQAPVIESEEQKLANRRQAQSELVEKVMAEKHCETRAAAYELARREKPDLFV